MAEIHADLTELVYEYTEGLSKHLWLDENYLPHGSPIEAIQTALNDRMLLTDEAIGKNARENREAINSMSRQGALNSFDRLYLEVDCLIGQMEERYKLSGKIKNYQILQQGNSVLVMVSTATDEEIADANERSRTALPIPPFLRQGK